MTACEEKKTDDSRMTLRISFTFPEICMPLPTPEIGKEKAKAISQMKHLRVKRLLVVLPTNSHRM